MRSITISSQIPRNTYDAIKVRSDVTIKQPYVKEIGIVIKLSTLLGTLPNNIFLTPSGVIVASHAPIVDDYDKRLVIPADKFHAIQISMQANKSPGVSYLLDGLSKKEWSEKAIQILAQTTIPEISIERIQTAHQYVRGLAATSLDEGFMSESSTSFLSSLARYEATMDFMNAEVPIKSSKGKGKGKKSSGQRGGLESCTPIEYPVDKGLGPEVPLYTPQQYWEDLVHKRIILPDFTRRIRFRHTYNADRIQSLRSGNAREPRPKGQNPTASGVLDIQSILKTHKHCRSPRDFNVPEFFNPYYQYSHTELVKLNMNLCYTPARFERWVIEPMVNMRYVNIPFNTEGNRCHHYKRPTMWPNPCHLANKECREGNNCRFAHCEQEFDVGERVLRQLAQDYPWEAGALIKVYREALRVVNSIHPNPQMLNTPSRCTADQKWLNANPVYLPTATRSRCE